VLHAAERGTPAGRSNAARLTLSAPNAAVSVSQASASVRQAGAGRRRAWRRQLRRPDHVTLSFYLYGDQAAGTVARETPLWQAWIQNASDAVGDEQE